MQVNARVDYALRAVIDIAGASEMVRKKELSERQDIPPRFLEQILAQLVRTGILQGTRGPSGGYALGRDAEDVTVADVVRAIDGPLAAVRGLPPEDVAYAPDAAIVRDVWIALRASMRAVLEVTTIADLATGQLPPSAAALLTQPGAWTRRGEGASGVNQDPDLRS